MWYINLMDWIFYRKKESKKALIPTASELKTIIADKEAKMAKEEIIKKEERLNKIRDIIGYHFYKGNHPFSTPYSYEYSVSRISIEEVDSLKDELEKLGYKIETKTYEYYSYFISTGDYHMYPYYHRVDTQEQLVSLHEMQTNTFLSKTEKKQFLKNYKKIVEEKRVISIKE